MISQEDAMDKIFSARLDESSIMEMDRAAHHLKITKKKFLENAIHLMAESVEGHETGENWAQTSGAWKRKESPAALIREIREKFKDNFKRRHP
jgi:hypothetical protein